MSRTRYLPALALCIVSIAATAQAQLITSTAGLPPVGGVYLDAGIHQTYGGAALQFLLSLPQHKVIADELKQRQGVNQFERFLSELKANVVVTQNGNPIFNGPIQASGLTDTMVFNKYDGLNNEIMTGAFQTEMLAMNLSGTTPLGPFMIRESPTLPSLGATTVTPIGGGQFLIDSFFDVFTELSIDGGQTWMPSTTGPGHVTLVPEPTSIAILAIGMFAFAAARRRH